MNCPPDAVLRELFRREGGADAALLEHLADCPGCRARLQAAQLRASVAAAAEPRPRGRAAWRPALAVALVAALAGLWWWPSPAPERWRAPDARPLAAIAASPAARARGQPQRLRWTPPPQAHAYRLVCYRASEPEWLRRALQLPEVTLAADELRAAPAVGVCRLDGELGDGGWVSGDEQPLVLQR